MSEKPLTPDNYAIIPNGWRAWMARQPKLVHAVAVALTILAGFFGGKCCTHPECTPVPEPAPEPAPTPVMVGSERLSNNEIGEKMRVSHARRKFCEMMRRRLSERLQKDGFALIGGPATPLKKEDADFRVAGIEDEMILHGAVACGAVGDGKILDKLGAILDWLIAHKDQIEVILKWLMTLLAIFGEPQAVGFIEMPDGGFAVAAVYPDFVVVLNLAS